MKTEQRDRWLAAIRRVRYREDRAPYDHHLRRELEDELEALVEDGCVWPTVLERLLRWYRDLDEDLESALEIAELLAENERDPQWKTAVKTLRTRVKFPEEYAKERNNFVTEMKRKRPFQRSVTREED